MRNTLATKLIFELSQPGRRAHSVAAFSGKSKLTEELIPRNLHRDTPPPLPELAEGDVVRHFTNLSTLNMSVDTHFYPLGSCTMKYNPKRNERLASLRGIVDIHPQQSAQTMQGLMELLYELQGYFAEISGLPAVSLQPAAGAHGELAALMVAHAYFRQRGEERRFVLTPDSSHGTNPASARVAGFEAITIKSNTHGVVDMDDLRAKLNDQVAVLMITNPNTLGLFDSQIDEICDLVHKAGGLVYLDGANMNAILGIARPGDFGADMMHYNPHKTFSGPHGGGGPGAGPICVRDFLEDYLPVPRIVRNADGDYEFLTNVETSIGRVRSFFGNVGVLVRAYCYLRTLGARGVREVSENAVLNANYLLSQLSDVLPVPHGNRCMHEFVASAESLKRSTGVTAMDLAKGLLDHGFHAPTVYFPLVVAEAMMIEPTETESKQTLDAFVLALRGLLGATSDDAHLWPTTTEVSRPDEVLAARKPVTKWKP
jgi:glycine dehydrogenase subunit 2